MLHRVDSQSNDNVTDTELLELARSRNAEAFRELVRRYEPSVAGTVRGMLGDGPEADDVGQETFIRFYKALDTFREESSIRTYLTRIAINLSLNALKRRKRLRGRYIRSDDLCESELPRDEGGAVEERERVEAVREAVQQLDPKHRAIVVLRMLEGYSTRETAELLDLPQGTVLSRLARGMKKLETILKHYIDEP